MKRLESAHLLQFFLYEAETFRLGGNCAFIGENAAGKTSALDAIQIALMGTHEGAIKLNSQRDGDGRDRTIREYCLGKMDDRFRREFSTTYITLVFRDEKTGRADSAGICISAAVDEPKHDVLGLFVVEGLELSLVDHLESDAAGQAPMGFPEFRSALEAKAKAASVRAMFFKDREKTAYVEQLVRTLSGKNWIDAKEFMRAFKRSMLLKSTESVDDFVRQFLVEAESVNKSAAAAQVDDFKRLRHLVEQVEDKIKALTELQGTMKDAERVSRRVASYTALHLALQVEQLGDADAEAEAQIEADTQTLKRMDERYAADEAECAGYEQRLQQIALALASDGAAQRKASLQGAIDGNGALLASIGSMLVTRLGKQSKALVAVRSLPEFADDYEHLTEVHDQIEAVAHRIKTGQPGADDAVENALQRAGEVLKGVLARVQAAAGVATSDQQKAELGLTAAKAAAEALEKTGVLLPTEYSLAYRRLTDWNIQPKSVCSMVKIKDSSWQPAIEAYLKKNRFAFVVPAALEERAIALLDRGEHGPRIHGVKIVRSKFVPDALKFSPSVVAAELAGDRIAVGFLAEQLSTLKKIETDAGLHTESNGLTRTGGLSKGRATQWLELPKESELTIGQPLDASKAEIARRALEASNLKTSSTVRLRQLSALQDSISKATGDEEEDQSFRAGLTKARELLATLERDQADIVAIDVGHLAELEAEKAAVTGKLQALRAAMPNDRLAAGKVTERIEQANAGIAARAEQVKRLSAEERAARSSEDYDADYAEAKRQDLTEPKAGVVPTLETVLHQLTVSIARDNKQFFDKVLPAARDGMRNFLERYPEHMLVEERTDWRRALKFVTAERTLLIDTTLVNYKNRLETATLAAEDAFRTHVAIKIKSAIKKMKRHIEDINNLLATCVFTNNEVYQFRYDAIPDWRPFIDYFELAGSPDGGASLFGGPSDISARVLDMLAEAASDKPSKNLTILDDYRLMYSFDVDIVVKGQRRARLSTRIGPGSGGEHRAPFYVIVGAALARAYRTDEGLNEAGAAVMLIDEAFNKVDSPNTIAAMKFFKRMGLQVIMSAPMSERGKLTAVSDTLFEVVRFEWLVSVRPIRITEKGQTLMQSDLPALNPQLVEQRRDLLLQQASA